MIFVDRSLTAAAVAAAADVRDGPAPRRDGRRQGRGPRRRRRPELHDYEELLAAAAPVEFRVDDENRAASMCYTSGTTGNPKGVVYSPPLDVPAHDGRDDWPTALGVARARRDPAGRADVPRQRVGPRPRRAWRRARPRDARPRPLAAGDRRPHRGRAGDDRRRRADDLDGRAARARRAATRRRLRAIPCGGSAVPRALSEALPRAARAADPAGVGHDRDQPGRVGRAHQVARCATDSDDELADLRTTVGRRRARCRAARRRARHRSTPLPWDGESTRRAAGARARGSPRRTTTTSGRRESFTDDGWLRPATSPRSTPRATSASSTARRTSSSRAASGSARSSSRTRSWPIPKVAEAAVIGVPHPKWAERPLACVVVKPGRGAHEGRGPRLPRGRSWPSGGCPTTWSSSTRCRRPRSASSRRRTCAPASPTTPCPAEPSAVLGAGGWTTQRKKPAEV